MRSMIRLYLWPLAITVSIGLVVSTSAAQVRRGPLIEPSAVVPLAESQTAGYAVLGNAAGDPVPPLTREQYKAGLGHWALVGMVVGLATGVVFAVTQKPTDATQRAWRPIGDALVIAIATTGGATVGMALFMLTHGRPPRE